MCKREPLSGRHSISDQLILLLARGLLRAVQQQRRTDGTATLCPKSAARHPTCLEVVPATRLTVPPG